VSFPAVLALGACTAGGPDGKGPTIAGLKVEPAPLESRPSEEAQRKRPGLISGEDGAFTVYRKLDRGSADPDKPEKVKR
jgi:hypothetical protein